MKKSLKALLLVGLIVLIPSFANASVGFRDAGGATNAVADIDCYPDAACSQSNGVATIDTRYEAENVLVIDDPTDTTSSVTAARTGYVYVLRSQDGPVPGGVGYTLTLPTAASGLTYTFTTATSATLSVKTASGDFIINGPADVTRLTSPASSGSTLTVVGNTNAWYVTSMGGGYNGGGATFGWTPALT